MLSWQQVPGTCTIVNLIVMIKIGSVANYKSLQLFPKIFTAMMNQSFISDHDLCLFHSLSNDIIANKIIRPDCRSHLLKILCLPTGMFLRLLS